MPAGPTLLRKGIQTCAAGKMPQHVSMPGSLVACGHWCVDRVGHRPKGPEPSVVLGEGIVIGGQ